jgi:hypothetical protein
MNLFDGSMARPMKSLRTSDNGSLNNLRSRGSEEDGCPDWTISPINHRDPLLVIALRQRRSSSSPGNVKRRRCLGAERSFMSARYIIRHSPDSRGCGAILAVFRPHSQQGLPATATLDSESQRLPCLAADTKTPPGAQPSGVLKKPRPSLGRNKSRTEQEHRQSQPRGVVRSFLEWRWGLCRAPRSAGLTAERPGRPAGSRQEARDVRDAEKATEIFSL